MDDRGRHETVAEMLEAWDRGDSVWSIEMGGLGPGYEQAIQILAIECLRAMHDARFEWSGDQEADTERLSPILDSVTSIVNDWPGCGFSGAQVEGAYNIATLFHRHGPIAALEKADEDRRIQVSKAWPHQP